MNTDIQWSKQEDCFERATQVWLAVNHDTSVSYGKLMYCSKHILQMQVSLEAVNQIMSIMRL